MSRFQAAQITIGKKDADHVSISIIGCLNAWMNASIQISADTWTGTCRAEFAKGELRQFASEIENLYKELSGVALLRPIEPYLELKLTGDGIGHVLVEGKAQDRLSVGTSLLFQFEVDQTELPAIISELRSADSGI